MPFPIEKENEGQQVDTAAGYCNLHYCSSRCLYDTQHVKLHSATHTLRLQRAANICAYRAVTARLWKQAAWCYAALLCSASAKPKATDILKHSAYFNAHIASKQPRRLHYMPHITYAQLPDSPTPRFLPQLYTLTLLTYHSTYCCWLTRTGIASPCCSCCTPKPCKPDTATCCPMLPAAAIPGMPGPGTNCCCCCGC
jgi:hypothetical protein